MSPRHEDAHEDDVFTETLETQLVDSLILHQTFSTIATLFFRSIIPFVRLCDHGKIRPPSL